MSNAEDDVLHSTEEKKTFVDTPQPDSQPPQPLAEREQQEADTDDHALNSVEPQIQPSQEPKLKRTRSQSKQKRSKVSDRTRNSKARKQKTTTSFSQKKESPTTVDKSQKTRTKSSKKKFDIAEETGDKKTRPQKKPTNPLEGQINPVEVSKSIKKNDQLLAENPSEEPDSENHEKHVNHTVTTVIIDADNLGDSDLGTEEPNCLEERIHFSGCIQPHGTLIACESEHLTITHISENTTTLFSKAAPELIGCSLAEVFPQRVFTQITSMLERVSNQTDTNTGTVQIFECLWCGGEDAVEVQILLHHNADNLIILELVPSSIRTTNDFLSFYQTVREAARALQAAPDFQTLCEQMTHEIAQITGFDRVMVYQYDQQYNGQVIAETKTPHLQPLLGLHFPDIDTRPCRPVYQLLWSRIISDITVPDVAIIPDCNQDSSAPLDLTYSLLRGISSCHKEYLQNMEVRATLVLSIIHNNQLWGLVSCHHSQPYSFSYETQQACEFLSQVFAVELTFKQQQQNYQYHLQLKTIQEQLVEQLSQPKNSIAGLCAGNPHLLSLFEASGAAVHWQNEYHTCGDVPEKSDILTLVDWLDEQQPKNVFATDHLSECFPAAKAFAEIVSGVLAIAISPGNYLMWFRPEVIQTVNWAGDPRSASDEEGESPPLSPRTSFELWQEIVVGHSLPWKACELEVAKNFRQAIVKIVLSQAAALQKLNQDLERSNAELERFAYIASHDLQEPLNLVASYVQLLEMRYGAEFDEDGKDFINFAVEGVTHMQTLIDDLLAYSRIGTRAQKFAHVETQAALDRVLKQLRPRIEQSQAVITADALPTVWGDGTQLLQLFQNLIGNALKFCQEGQPQIQIQVQAQGEQWQFSIQDNGIGIDPQFQERIFLIFQRLHTRDEYPGTGIGLAICKKIVAHHGGEIWVESELGQGTTMHFTLSANDPEP